MSVPQIARMWMTDEEHVRRVIHDFNERGFESLRPRFGGGRPRRISSDDEQRIVAIAGARPDSLGVPYTRWNLSKLSGYLQGQIGNPEGDDKPNKKYYDPRVWLRKGEEKMRDRLKLAYEDLNAVNRN